MFRLSLDFCGVVNALIIYMVVASTFYETKMILKHMAKIPLAIIYFWSFKAVKLQNWDDFLSFRHSNEQITEKTESEASNEFLKATANLAIVKYLNVIIAQNDRSYVHEKFGKSFV